jgi:hypothetical protein
MKPDVGGGGGGGSFAFVDVIIFVHSLKLSIGRVSDEESRIFCFFRCFARRFLNHT